MKDEELLKELERKKSEYERKIEICQSNIAAISSTIFVLKHSDATTDVDGSLRQMILTAIEHAPREFSLRDVEEFILRTYPETRKSNTVKSSIASSFWKIVKEEMKLEIVDKGSGPKPTIYRKKPI
jgi:tartrate dehydratase alpha subunit/fumarate hydratase class I-like protein